ncbi:MAG: extracellular solute-binding protein [Chloroflexi bacterium]|nr:extracellular solute-binding protein [Chloroflexota bacterium]
MGKRFYVSLISVIFLMFGAASCAPKTAPAPAASTPPRAGPTPTSPLSNLSPPTSQDAAWAKVVEAARKEGRVVIYSFNFTGELGIMLQKAFKKRYGLDLEIVTGRGAEFIERLKTEKRVGQITADTTEGSAIHVKNMKLEGITVGVAGDLPAVNEKGKWVIDPFSLDPQDRHLIVHFISTYAPHVNTRLVKPGEEPKVWRDLLDPKWKGKMTITDHNIGGGPYLLFPPLMREKIIDDNFIRALYKQDLRFATSVVDESAQLARGEQYLMIRGSDSTSARFVAEGAPIRAAELQDGTTISPGTAAAIAGAPHPNAAKVFLNWIMSQEGQTVHGEGKKMGSVRTDVQDFRPAPLAFVPKRPVVMTVEDNDDGTRLFREKWINKLIGQ